MSKVQELNRAKNLLNQAISVALNSMPENKSVQEARNYMKRAINELDNATKSQVQKKVNSNTLHQQHWNNLVAGGVHASIANGAHSQTANETYSRSLSQLNMMIAREEDKLAELEKKSVKVDAVTQILGGIADELLND